MSDPDDWGERDGAQPAAEEPPAAATIAERLAFLDLTAADVAALAATEAGTSRDLDGLLDRFHAHLLAFPPLATRLREEPDRLDRLRESDRAYFLSLAGARFDAEYFEQRARVGTVLAEIGVEPSWYVGALAFYLRGAVAALVERSGDGARILPTLEALVKIVFLDVSLAIESYVRRGFVAREVTEGLERATRTAEQAVRDRTELERMKDELATMVVHDLKNPVTGIMMTVALLLRKNGKMLAEHRGLFQQIDVTCREMMRLIQNLLEMARLDAGELSADRQPAPLAEVVADAVRELEPIVARSGRTLVVRVPPDVPPVLCDQRLLRRVVVNLIMNALRRGRAAVEVTGAKRPGLDEATLEVCIRGREMTAEERERVFAPDAARNARDDETARDPGLGLPFCKLAVDRMGGRISVESTPYTGTVFTVTLPARDV